MIEVPFPLQEYGYVVIPGLVYRGRKQARVNFLLDTGASTTIIDPHIMARIGYTPSCPEYRGHARVSNPAGIEQGYKVMVDKVLIHSAELVMNTLEIVCIRPERSVEALLGLNFLRHFHYCIDHKKHLLTLQLQ